MRSVRSVLSCSLLLALTAPAFAGAVENAVESRWLGAWVVTNVETQSDCAAFYTNNRVNGQLVRSKGDYRFAAGELGKLDKIDVNRSRIDVMVSYPEPLLVAYQEGPFTLYREATCKIELEVEVPRDVVKGRDIDSIDDALAQVLERHPTEAEATASTSWNRRQVEPYPQGYDRTLAQLAVWRAEQTNSAVQARLDAAFEAADRLVERIAGDPAYLEGFAAGVDETRRQSLGSCGNLLAIDIQRLRVLPPRNGDAEDARRAHGVEDGRKLVLAMAMMRRLPQCFVPVPDGPQLDMAAAN